MLVAWAFCNRGRVSGDTRFPGAAVIVCPNLTIKERLQVLRPEVRDNYFEQFEVVPSQLMPELQKGRVLVTNWHAFAPESEHAEGGETFRVVQKGEESPAAFAKRVLGEIAERGPVMVLKNDHLEFTIPYDYFDVSHVYYPDFIVRLSDGTNLVLEIKGQQTPQDNAKHQAASRWVSAVNRWGKLGRWTFAVCREPQTLRPTLLQQAA